MTTIFNQNHVIAGMISHTDLDGYGCEVVLRAAMNNNPTTVCITNNEDSGVISHVGYSNFTLKIFDAWIANIIGTLDREYANDSNVEYYAFVTDLLIPQDICDRIEKINKESPNFKVIVVDHHIQKSDIMKLGKYALVESKLSDNNGCGLPCCATKLLYQYMREFNSESSENFPLANPFVSNETLHNFVTRVNTYDTFTSEIMRDPFVNDLNDMLYLIGGHDFVKKITTAIEMDRGLSCAIGKEVKNIIDRNRYIENKQIQEALDNRFNIPRNETPIPHEVTMCVGSRINATAMSKYLSDNNLFDVYQIIGLFNPVTSTISFRSTGDNDVSEIAKKLGGGGHKNAAGAVIKDPRTCTAIMSNYYDAFSRNVD